MQNKDITQIIAAAKGAGVQFASFVYRAKGTGELSRYTVNLNVDTENTYRRDLLELETTESDWRQKGELFAEALEAIRASLEKSLSEGIGKREDYVHRDRLPVAKGVTMDNEANFFLSGMIHTKKIIEPPTVEKKAVKSRPLTIAKKAIEKTLRKSKLRTFKIDAAHIKSVRVNGAELVFDT